MVPIQGLAHEANGQVSLFVLDGFHMDSGQVEIAQPLGKPSHTDPCVVPRIASSHEAQDEGILAVEGRRRREVKIALIRTEGAGSCRAGRGEKHNQNQQPKYSCENQQPVAEVPRVARRGLRVAGAKKGAGTEV